MLHEVIHYPYCPGCGRNLERDRQVQDHGWTVEPNRVLFGKQQISLTACECAFLHTLASAHGRPVSAEVIGSRISSAEDPRNFANVYAVRLRRKLADLVGVVPFETVRHSGYRWAA